MENVRTRIALCYDFDGTLSKGYMQDVSFLPGLGISPAYFWQKTNLFAREHNMDSNLAYMHLMISEAKDKGVKLSKEALMNFGRDIVFFEGLDTWFSRINEYGLRQGIEVEHFVISSGIEEIIKGTAIAKYFKYIFAGSFFYDENNYAVGPATAVNYTNKTQHLFRINKGIFNYYENERVNQYIPDEEKYIHFSNMVYIGDGETDIPCMKITMQQGGFAISVYEKDNSKIERISKRLLADKRVNFIAAADYSQDSRLENIIKMVINNVKAQGEIRALAKKQAESL